MSGWSGENPCNYVTGSLLLEHTVKSVACPAKARVCVCVCVCVCDCFSSHLPSSLLQELAGGVVEVEVGVARGGYKEVCVCVHAQCTVCVSEQGVHLASLYLPFILICSQVGRVDMIGGGVETGAGGPETGVGGVETGAGGPETVVGGAEIGAGGAEAGVDEAEVPDEAANGKDKVPGTSTATATTTSTTTELLDSLLQTCRHCSVNYPHHFNGQFLLVQTNCVQNHVLNHHARGSYKVCASRYRVHGICAAWSLPSVCVQGVLLSMLSEHSA